MSKPADAEQSEGVESQPSSDDARWVAATLSGDHAAFDVLVRRYQRQAVSVAYRLVNDLHDAADVAQDAFLRAYQGLSGLEEPARFAPWLMRIVSNLALNFRRARGAGVRKQAVPLDGVDPAGAAQVARAEAAGAAVDPELPAELGDAIRVALEELPEKQKLAFVLFCLEGLPQKDVADILDCSVELVKWNVFQARKSLRTALGDYVS